MPARSLVGGERCGGESGGRWRGGGRVRKDGVRFHRSVFGGEDLNWISLFFPNVDACVKMRDPFK